MKKQPWMIDLNNPDMCAWAYSYLRRRFSLPPKGQWESEGAFCCNLLNNPPNAVTRFELETNMQGAWRQKKHRDNQKRKGKKPCSFTLSNNAIRELDRLAKGLGESINETLERLIHQTYIIDKEQKRQTKLAKKQTLLTVL